MSDKISITNLSFHNHKPVVTDLDKLFAPEGDSIRMEADINSKMLDEIFGHAMSLFETNDRYNGLLSFITRVKSMKTFNKTYSSVFQTKTSLFVRLLMHYNVEFTHKVSKDNTTMRHTITIEGYPGSQTK